MDTVKKRGRKKKEVVEEVEKEPKVKKKRGRKAALKFFSSSIRKKIPISSSTTNENVILHLDIKHNMDDTEDNDVIQAANEIDYHSEYSTSQKDKPKPVVEKSTSDSITGPDITLLHDFMTDEWKEQTDIHCWWCCHTFDTIPLGMPFRYLSDQHKFRTKGCFCSIACMVSWFNNSIYRTDTKIYTLIKNLHKRLTGSNGIQKLAEAPPRETLNIFGGELTIDQFRKRSDNGIIFKMINYPMIVTKEFIEEIDLLNLKIHNKQHTTNSNSITPTTAATEKEIKDAKIRLSKIEKPNTENTIDKFLKLKIEN